MNSVDETEHPLLIEAIADLAQEMREGLRDLLHAGQPNGDWELIHILIEEIDQLRMDHPCGCQDDFCASFYTVPRPANPDGWLSRTQGGRNFGLKTRHDYLILRTVDGYIANVEVLFRPEIKAKRDAIFGRETAS